MDNLEHIAKIIESLEVPLDDLTSSLKRLEEEQNNLKSALNKMKSEICFRQDDREVCHEFGLDEMIS